MSSRRDARRAARALTLLVALAACTAGTPLQRRSALRNGGPASTLVSRTHAGGRNEGPLGFLSAVSASAMYEELARQGIRAETLGPLNQIRDRRTLLAVMETFTYSLGVRCDWCHMRGDFRAPTPRKAAAAFMWDQFVGRLEFHDGRPLYCDSCHHEQTIFLRRQPSESLALVRYMQSEYVDQLRRRDGAAHGCATCHGQPFNSHFLPRMREIEGYDPPAAHPGPSESGRFTRGG